MDNIIDKTVDRIIDIPEDLIIDMSDTMYNYATTIPNNITVSTAGSSINSSIFSSGYLWNTTNTAPAALDIKGDATFQGDIKWQGRSLGKLLESIESRLAILQEPSPEKLEKYAALKKAYDHYKTLERLIGED